MENETVYDYLGFISFYILKYVSLNKIIEKQNLCMNYLYKENFESLGIELYNGEKNNCDFMKLFVNEDNYFELQNYDKNSFFFSIHTNYKFYLKKEIANDTYNYIKNQKENIIRKNPYKDRYQNNNDCYAFFNITDMILHPNSSSIEFFLKTIKMCKCENLYISRDIWHPENDEIIKKMITPTGKKNETNLIFIDYDEINTIQFASTCKNVLISHGNLSTLIGYLSFYSNVFYEKRKSSLFYSNNHKKEKKCVDNWFGGVYSIPDCGWFEIEV